MVKKVLEDINCHKLIKLGTYNQRIVEYVIHNESYTYD